MAEVENEPFDKSKWSGTMNPDEHLHTYGNFIELVKVGIAGVLAVLFALMIFAFGDGTFMTASSIILVLFALYTSVAGIMFRNTTWIPALVVAGVAFVIWLFAVL